MKKVTKDTVIKLKKDDAALVIKNSDGIQMFVPATDPDAEISAGVLTIVILGMLLDEGDKTLEKLIMKRTEALMKEKVKQEKDMKSHGRNKKTVSRKVRK